MLRVFGYAKPRKDDWPADLIELSSVSLCFVNAEEAERFSKFATQCASLMRSMGDDYSHEHFFSADADCDVTIERLIE